LPPLGELDAQVAVGQGYLAYLVGKDVHVGLTLLAIFIIHSTNKCVYVKIVVKGGLKICSYSFQFRSGRRDHCF
jgi:hypothetical protein